MKLEPFAWFMDRVVYPVSWLVSTNVRLHAIAVKDQDAHLCGEGHRPPKVGCGWCWEANKVKVSEQTYTDMAEAFMSWGRHLEQERYSAMTSVLDQVEIT